MQRKNTTNTSGFPGVSAIRSSRTGLIESWVAYSPKENGFVSKQKKFSVVKYGEQQALALAVQVRKEFVAAFETTKFIPKHAAKRMLLSQ